MHRRGGFYGVHFTQRSVTISPMVTHGNIVSKFTFFANKNPVISRLHAYVTGFSFLPNFIAHDFCIPAITVATQLLLTHFAVEIT